MTQGKLLVVDDDEGVRTDLVETLERAGFSVTSGQDCRSGWHEFNGAVFDLVLLDLKMPDFQGRLDDQGGIRLLDRIKTAEGSNLSSPPVWILTATPTRASRSAAEEGGADRYVDKAVFFANRKRLIGEIWTRVGLPAPPAPTPRASPAPPSTGKVIGFHVPPRSNGSAATETTTTEAIMTSAKMADPAPETAGVVVAKSPTSKATKTESSSSLPRAPHRALVIQKAKKVSLDAKETEILEKLYRDCSEIYVSPLIPGLSRSSVFRIDCVDTLGQATEPFVTKINQAQRLQAEYDNFGKYVANRLSGSRHPAVSEIETSSDGTLAGLRISFVGTDWRGMMGLKQYIDGHSAEEVGTVLDNLFGDTFLRWHRAKLPARPILAIEEYNFFSDSVRDVGNKIRGAMQRFFKEHKGLALIDLGVTNATPFHEPAGAFETWAQHLANLRVESHRCTIHGDLNLGNVLVDAEQSSWLLDFEETKIGPILMDFIELETSIKYGCFDGSLEDLWLLERTLLAQRDFRHRVQLKHGNPSLQKVFAAVTKVREYAYMAQAPSRDMQEYYLGLVFYSLNLLRYPNRYISRDKKACILLASALLFDKFKTPGMPIGFVGEEIDSPAPPEDPRDPRRILVVDDEPDQRDMIARLLRKLDDVEVITLDGVPAAIEALRDGPRPELWITDMEMPGFDGAQSPKAGLDLLTYLSAETPDVPVVVLSGVRDQKLAVESIRRYGAVTFFGKADVALKKQDFLDEIEEILLAAKAETVRKRDSERMIELLRSTQPERFPNLDGLDIARFMEPLEEVGGDLLDCAQVGDHEICLLIGDVKGKGTPAAVLLSQLYTMYRGTGLPTVDTLTSSLERWNQFLLDKQIFDEVMPLFLGVIDLRRGLVRYVNAGQNLPFVVSQSGEVQELSVNGPMLGMVPKPGYTLAHAILQPGDVLVFYSDGFSEGLGPRQERYGAHRLQACVEVAMKDSAATAGSIQQAVLDDFESFRQGHPATDDRTLVVLKLGGEED